MKRRKLAELHVHLEGCVWDPHIQGWWKKSEFLFPPPKLCYDNDFDKFLGHLRFRYNFLNTPDAYARVARDYAVQAISNGIVYAEVTINMALILSWNLDLQKVLSKINRTTKKIDHGPVLRFILEIPWQFTDKNYDSLFGRIDDLKQMGVVGFGLGGDEKQAEPKGALKVFNAARKAGLKTVCHAGEIPGNHSARGLVEELKPDRIVHAVSIADWIESLGPKSPPVDVCFSSNMQLHAIEKISDHPFKRWVEAGVPVCLSTDDPAIFNTSLQNEFHIASRNFDIFETFSLKMEENFVKAAFDKDALKSATGNRPSLEKVK